MACVGVVAEKKTRMAHKGTYQDFHTSQKVEHSSVWNKPDPRPVTILHPPVGEVWRPPPSLFSVRPPVCWLVSAPPWVRAWTLTSRWSCCYWLCGCGCWGPLCRIWTLYSWLCYVVHLQWQERAVEENSRRCWWEIRDTRYCSPICVSRRILPQQVKLINILKINTASPNNFRLLPPLFISSSSSLSYSYYPHSHAKTPTVCSLSLS